MQKYLLNRQEKKMEGIKDKKMQSLNPILVPLQYKTI